MQNGLYFKKCAKLSREESEKLLNGDLEWMKNHRKELLADFYLPGYPEQPLSGAHHRLPERNVPREKGRICDLYHRHRAGHRSMQEPLRGAGDEAPLAWIRAKFF